jgi:8-oxo-dGTP pyrophosphatase MutT (NUDIX family)
MIRKRAEIYILKDGKIYIGTKSKEIEIPGGKVERGESPRDAAVRETLEEVGIKVKNIQNLANIPFVTKFPPGNKIQTRLTYSFKADFNGFDKRKWGAGPEGKLYPALVKIDKLIKYFNNKVKITKEQWEENQYNYTIKMLELVK